MKHQSSIISASKKLISCPKTLKCRCSSESLITSWGLVMHKSVSLTGQQPLTFRVFNITQAPKIQPVPQIVMLFLAKHPLGFGTFFEKNNEKQNLHDNSLLCLLCSTLCGSYRHIFLCFACSGAGSKIVEIQKKSPC